MLACWVDLKRELFPTSMRVAGYQWLDVTDYARFRACPMHVVLVFCVQLGVPLPSQQEYVTKGTVRHPKSGKIGISREEGNVTFSRSGLAQYLIDQAKVGPAAHLAPQGVLRSGVAVPSHATAQPSPATQQLLLQQHAV